MIQNISITIVATYRSNYRVERIFKDLIHHCFHLSAYGSAISMAYRYLRSFTDIGSPESMATQQPFSPSVIAARKDRISSEAARSSREPSAAASEYDRKAEEQQQKLEEIRARKQSLIEQQAVVDEEEKLAEETLRSYSTQAASERRQYAAVVQRYDETVADKQEQFRLQLAKEVDLRIVRSLLGGDELTLDAINAVAEGRHSPDEMEFFKARFADSLAGSDPAYFSYRAAQVLIWYSNALVDEQAVETVEDSKICFSVTQSTYKDPVTPTAAHSVVHAAKSDEVTAQVQDDKNGSDNGKAENVSDMQQSERSQRSPTATAASPAEKVGQALQPETVVIKQEARLTDREEDKEDKRRRRLSMEQIDERTETSQSRGTSSAAFTSFQDDDQTDRTEGSLAQEKEGIIHMTQSKQPAPLFRKRKNSQVDEDTDDERSQVSEPAKVEKKRKTTAKAPTAG